MHRKWLIKGLIIPMGTIPNSVIDKKEKERLLLVQVFITFLSMCFNSHVSNSGFISSKVILS